MSLPCSTVAPRARKASRCGSSRRRPITSPPGGGIVAAPKRASSGPAARKEARMRSASAESTSVLCTLAAHRTTVLGSGRSTVTPRSASRSSRASVSRIRGTLCRVTRSSVSNAQASSGSAAFLFPAGTTVPDSGTPPSITNFSIGAAARLPTRMSVPMTRDEAWTLFCEWTASESLRRHVLAVEACMRAYAEKFGEDRGALGDGRDAPRPRLRALSGSSHRPSALRAGRARAARVPRGHGARGRLARRLPRGLARHADGEDAVRRRRAVRAS